MVLAHAASPAVAEADAAELIQREGVRPRTVRCWPIMLPWAAQPESRLSHRLDRHGRPQRREAVREAATRRPAAWCPLLRRRITRSRRSRSSRAIFAKVVPLGVGRIPLESAADASVLFARGLLRERLLAGRRRGS